MSGRRATGLDLGMGSVSTAGHERRGVRASRGAGVRHRGAAVANVVGCHHPSNFPDMCTRDHVMINGHLGGVLALRLKLTSLFYATELALD